MKHAMALAVGCAALFGGSLYAAEPIALHANNAGELAELCNANPREPGSDARLNFCDGYAQGAVAVDEHFERGKRPFCLQGAPNRRATLREFAGWVQANGERRGMEAAPALFRFLSERFPCRS